TGSISETNGDNRFTGALPQLQRLTLPYRKSRVPLVFKVHAFEGANQGAFYTSLNDLFTWMLTQDAAKLPTLISIGHTAQLTGADDYGSATAAAMIGLLTRLRVEKQVKVAFE